MATTEKGLITIAESVRGYLAQTHKILRGIPASKAKSSLGNSLFKLERAFTAYHKKQDIGRQKPCALHQEIYNVFLPESAFDKKGVCRRAEVDHYVHGYKSATAKLTQFQFQAKGLYKNARNAAAGYKLTIVKKAREAEAKAKAKLAGAKSAKAKAAAKKAYARAKNRRVNAEKDAAEVGGGVGGSSLPLIGLAAAAALVVGYVISLSYPKK